MTNELEQRLRSCEFVNDFNINKACSSVVIKYGGAIEVLFLKLAEKSIPKLLDAPPTVEPSNLPSLTPTVEPSYTPTVEPTLSYTPTIEPSLTPTMEPSNLPSLTPTVEPSLTPTVEPTLSYTPTIEPSLTPTMEPSTLPSLTPTVEPSYSPTVEPTLSYTPTIEPSYTPTVEPSNLPSLTPAVEVVEKVIVNTVGKIVHQELDKYKTEMMTEIILTVGKTLRVIDNEGRKPLWEATPEEFGLTSEALNTHAMTPVRNAYNNLEESNALREQKKTL